MSSFFTKVLGDDSAEMATPWTQPQREALLDLLVHAMYADGHLSLAEGEVVEREMEAVPWQGVGTVGDYVVRATERIRILRATEDGQANLFASVRERLGSPEHRAKALALCESLLAADGRTEREEVFAERCRQALGLDSRP
jgi:hypothetical protein